MASAVGAAQILQKDGSIVFSYAGVLARNCARRIGGGEVHLGIDTLTGASPTDQVAIVTEGKLNSVGAG